MGGGGGVTTCDVIKECGTSLKVLCSRQLQIMGKMVHMTLEHNLIFLLEVCLALGHHFHNRFN